MTRYKNFGFLVALLASHEGIDQSVVLLQGFEGTKNEQSSIKIHEAKS